MKFNSITICLDMHGCPNRCKHCWVGHAPNGNLSVDDLRWTAAQFRPYTDILEVDDWYREPDFHDDYKALWELCENLSDRHHPHFELVSVWRLVRDPEYVDWLKSLGLKTAQLTLFGGEEKTDLYTGRQGAYRDIMRAMEILQTHQITPRIQVFVNKETLPELPLVEALGEENCFVHQGSCDGENERFYDIWVTPEDLRKIPPRLAASTLRHFGKESLAEVFGSTEQALYARLINDHSTASLAEADPVFYIDSRFNVYPNFTAPSPAWLLGNLKADGIEQVLKTYVNDESLAQHVRKTVPVSELVRAGGDPDSRRLFGRGDYIDLLLNRYCRHT